VRKLFCLDKTPFNWREAQAATFDDIANLSDDQIRTDMVVLPAPVDSDGTIPFERDPVLSPTDRQSATEAMSATGILPAVHAAEEVFATAAAAPVRSPMLRKPTDLMMLMARAVQHTLGEMKITPAKNVKPDLLRTGRFRFHATCE